MAVQRRNRSEGGRGSVEQGPMDLVWMWVEYEHGSYARIKTCRGDDERKCVKSTLHYHQGRCSLKAGQASE